MKKYQHYIDALGGVLPTHLDLDISCVIYCSAKS